MPATAKKRAAVAAAATGYFSDAAKYCSHADLRSCESTSMYSALPPAFVEASKNTEAESMAAPATRSASHTRESR